MEIEIQVGSIRIEYLPATLEWDGKVNEYSEAPKIVISSADAPSNGKRLILSYADLLTLKVAICGLETRIAQNERKDPTREV